jgi:hypothetical protein
MNIPCGKCLEWIEETQAKAKSHVCDCWYHTECLIAHISSSWSAGKYCPNCDATLQEPNAPQSYYDDAPEADVTALSTLQEQPEFREDLKKVKEKVRAATKAYGLYQKAKVQAKRQWKENTAVMIQVLKEAKKAATTGLIQSEAYKAMRRTESAETTAKTKFCKKYELSYYQRRALFSRRRRYHRSLCYVFSVRI